MKNRSKWNGDSHGAYCKCDKCSEQDFNIHKDLELDNEVSDIRREFSGTRIDSDNSDYLNNIDRIFGD